MNDLLKMRRTAQPIILDDTPSDTLREQLERDILKRFERMAESLRQLRRELGLEEEGDE